MSVGKLFFGRYSELTGPKNESGTLAGLLHHHHEKSEYAVVEDVPPFCPTTIPNVRLTKHFFLVHVNTIIIFFFICIFGMSAWVFLGVHICVCVCAGV